MAELKAFITMDFKTKLPDTISVQSDMLDMRNYIYARNPTYTKESYLGYLNIVEQLAMSQTYEGGTYMLRLGFIPLTVAPSFWGDKTHTVILSHIPKESPYYLRPAVSFPNSRYRSGYPDIWASKLDATKSVGYKPELAATKGVLEKCGL